MKPHFQIIVEGILDSAFEHYQLPFVREGNNSGAFIRAIPSWTVVFCVPCWISCRWLPEIPNIDHRREVPMPCRPGWSRHSWPYAKNYNIIIWWDDDATLLRCEGYMELFHNDISACVVFLCWCVVFTPTGFWFVMALGLDSQHSGCRRHVQLLEDMS
jgi:hypothetical protein